MTKKSFLSTCLVTVLAFAAIAVFLNSQSAFSKSSDSAWQIRCDKDEAGKATHCEMFSRLNLQKTNERVVEFAIGYPKGDKLSAARGIIVMPLGIDLQDDAVILVDEKAIFHAKINYCLKSGCYALVTLPDQIVTQFKKGNDAALKFKANNGKFVMVKIPLTGFTKTFKELTGEK